MKSTEHSPYIHFEGIVVEEVTVGLVETCTLEGVAVGLALGGAEEDGFLVGVLVCDAEGTGVAVESR